MINAFLKVLRSKHKPFPNSSSELIRSSKNPIMRLLIPERHAYRQAVRRLQGLGKPGRSSPSLVPQGSKMLKNHKIKKMKNTINTFFHLVNVLLFLACYFCSHSGYLTKCEGQTRQWICKDCQLKSDVHMCGMLLSSTVPVVDYAIAVMFYIFSYIYIALIYIIIKIWMKVTCKLAVDRVVYKNSNILFSPHNDVNC